jgi:hypothetical protein
MTKKMLAALPLICVLAFAMDGSGTVPSAAASTTPSVAAPTAPDMCAPTEPDTCAPTGPEWGGCRWYCGSKSYPSASQCAANCAVQCEDIC